MASFAMVPLFLNPFVGERLGRWNKKRCILFGMFLQTTSCLLFTFCYYITDHWSFIIYSLLLRTFGGFSILIGFNACYALGSDYYVDHVDDVVGYLEAAAGVAAAI
eukprot:CAMPEP_0114999566 /NCGR_PEP_ID=MMETSP0216-20121206/16222_1 /TAXON_ID=223996 /ORGANISM="Protocruzia adherens, Strain Boccale" /LENGTH=105 /DNA_ID=CAMNT_0002364465 /DNA_START=11 /DNA_END=325 /DNA_ORIENTATION=+